MTATAAVLGERALRRLGVAIVPVASRPALSGGISQTLIATRALLWLAVIAADETPATNDLNLAIAYVATTHDALIAQGIVTWAINAIPTAVADEYTMLTAMHLAPTFGRAADPTQQPVIEARVRKVSQIMAAPALATQRVLDIHRNLEARGKVRWSIQDLPPAAEDLYVILAAFQMAPEFGVHPTPGDDLIAMRGFAQIIALPSSGERVQTDYF